jgi:protein CSF1
MDQRLDQILTAYMDSGPGSKIPKPRMYVIDARLHLWRLSCWQMVKDSGSIEEVPRTASRLSSPTALCLATVQIARGSCAGHALSNGLVQLHAAFRRMDVLLRTALPHQPTSVPSGHITIDSSSINIHLKPLGISVSSVLGDIECTITDASPSVVLGIFSAYMLGASAILMEMKALKERATRARHLLIVRLLEYPKAAVPDPFSRAQVSFMVNSGRPKALRSDPSMGMIAMLGGCIRQIEPHDLREISLSMDQPISTDLYSDVVRLLKERFDHDVVDIDLENVTALSLLKLLFPDDTATPSSTDQYPQSPPFLVSLQTHKLKFSLGDPLVPRTELQVGSVRIHVREGLRPLLGSNTSRTSTPVGTVDQRSRTVHIIASCSITQARWNILPSSLSFLRTLLRLKSDRPAPNTDLHMVSSRSRDLVVEIFLEVDEAEALASAQLLNFGMRATGVRVSTTGIVFSGSDPDSCMTGTPFSFSVQAGSRELTLQANATEELSVLGPERAKLASLSALGGEACMILDSSKLRGTVSLGGLKLSVPRSAIKLYQFITEWSAEYLPYVAIPFTRSLADRIVSVRTMQCLRDFSLGWINRFLLL